ncbi:hypothetical protein U1Q18_014621, partial [Sarracenia purpurea var. burkii]
MAGVRGPVKGKEGEEEAWKSATKKEVAASSLVRHPSEVKDEPKADQKDEEVVSDSDSGEEGSDVECVVSEIEGDSGEEESPKPSALGINGEIEALLLTSINVNLALEGGNEVTGKDEPVGPLVLLAQPQPQQGSAIAPLAQPQLQVFSITGGSEMLPEAEVVHEMEEGSEVNEVMRLAGESPPVEAVLRVPKVNRMTEVNSK